MRHTLIFAAAFAASSISLTAAQAQTLSDNPAPAELPPAGYSGSQFADSRGCVFIRAGVDGNVTWVPRVTRDRKQVCSAQPTFAAAPAPAPEPQATQQQTAAVQAPAPTPAPVQTAPAATPAPTPAPAPTVAAAPKPARSAPIETVATTITRPPKPAVKPRPQPVAKPKPAAPAAAPTLRVVVAEEPRPAAEQTRTVVTSACPNASPFSQRYINDGTRHPVRCGPQTLPGTSQTVASGGGERILPTHVVEERRQASAVRVPHGYVPVWEDNRLNPKRGEQTVQGYQQTQRAWTNTVPRRLVPNSAQPHIKQPRVVGRASVQAPPPPVVSTKQTPQSAKAVVPQAKKAQRIYVQIGMFGVEANAQRSAQAMARTGFPTRLGTLKRSGKTYRLVMAGPFSSEAEAKRALAAAKRIGFSDAYLNRQK